MHDINWTHAEKKAARVLFDAALQRELNHYIASFKQSAAAIETPEALWSLLQEAEQKRREIDDVFDFRYSRLLWVFAGLLRRGVITESELAALGEEKASGVARIASM